MIKKAILFLLFTIVSFAQAPQGFSHRGTAYNTSGVVLQSTPIIINVKILNGDGGSIAYEETHNLTTNTNGQYSINIGQIGQNSTVISGNFSYIDWSTGQKWLEIGIAPSNDPTNYVNGSSQLMSVPYALFAKNADPSLAVNTVNNICELRNSELYKTPKIVIYVEGFREPADGGGGFFYWKEGLTTDDDDGMIIKPNWSNAGRWVRQIDNYINVKFYGSMGVLQPNDGSRIQKAINYAYSIGGGTVFIPKGNYKIYNTLILKNGVSILGEGLTSTVLTAGYASNDTYATTDTNSCNQSVIPTEGQTDTAYMIIMDEGRVMLNVSNLTLEGNGQSTDPEEDGDSRKRGCIYLGAIAKNVDGVNDGGLWRSTFKNINIYNFNGVGIHLDGGGSENGYSYNSPHQFLIFENVHILRKKQDSQCLQITGQIGQATFLNCLFDGLTYGGNPNTGPFKVIKGINVSISSEHNGAYNVQPAVISFINSTFELSEYGVYMNNSENVTFDNCWFEVLDNAITANFHNGFPSLGITVTNSRFANASGYGSLNVENLNAPNSIPQGRCITATNSEINVTNNYVTVSDVSGSATGNRDPFKKHFIVGTNSKGIRTFGNTFQDIRLAKTSGVANNSVSVTTNSNGNYVETFGHRFMLVNNSASNIQFIKSSLNAGETVTLKALANSVKFDNTKNIILTKPSPFTLNLNESATFIKIDGSYTNPNTSTVYEESWQLISVNKVN